MNICVHVLYHMILLNSDFFHWNGHEYLCGCSLSYDFVKLWPLSYDFVKFWFFCTEMAMNICVHVHNHITFFDFVNFWILSTEMAMDICDRLSSIFQVFQYFSGFSVSEVESSPPGRWSFLSFFHWSGDQCFSTLQFSTSGLSYMLKK